MWLYLEISLLQNNDQEPAQLMLTVYHELFECMWAREFAFTYKQPCVPCKHAAGAELLSAVMAGQTQAIH